MEGAKGRAENDEYADGEMREKPGKRCPEQKISTFAICSGPPPQPVHCRLLGRLGSKQPETHHSQVPYHAQSVNRR